MRLDSSVTQGLEWELVDGALDDGLTALLKEQVWTGSCGIQGAWAVILGGEPVEVLLWWLCFLSETRSQVIS